MKYLHCPLNSNSCLEAKHCALVSFARWHKHFSHANHFSWKKEWLPDKTVVIQTRIFGRSLVYTEKKETITSRHTDLFNTNIKILAFMWKIEIGETCICHYEMDGFPICKEFSHKSNDNIKKWDFFFLLLYNEWNTCNLKLIIILASVAVV